jgi:quercetin dioxygenase-like cupin family protein
MTVYKTNGMRIVLIALHEDALLKKHTADGIISVEVPEGELIFSSDDQSVVIIKGQMIALHKGLPHSVKAIKESVFLLTLTTTLDK